MATIDYIRQQIRDSAATKEAMQENCAGDIAQAAELLLAAVKAGKKILWCGNGGSAADAQHLSAELVGKLRQIRKPVASLALTTDTSFLTAWVNDADPDLIFARQVEALGAPGDVLVGITTSGNSPNVIAAISTARDQGLKTVVFCGGTGGRLGRTADVTIIIPAGDTQRIQEGHILTGHIICDLIEQAVLG
ncbi:MAG: SIS domain-containing protein [Candidatus Neomarinimicrobiota bacterium]